MAAITHVWADWLVAGLLLLSVGWVLSGSVGVAAVVVAVRGRRSATSRRAGDRVRPFKNPWSDLDRERLSDEYAAQRDALARAVRGR